MTVPYSLQSDDVSAIISSSNLSGPPLHIFHSTPPRHPNQVAYFVSPDPSVPTRSSRCLAEQEVARTEQLAAEAREELNRIDHQEEESHNADLNEESKERNKNRFKRRI